MPDSTHKPAPEPRLGVALTFGHTAEHAVHVRTDPAGVAEITARLTAVSGTGDGVQVGVVAVTGRPAGDARVRRYTIPAAEIDGLAELALELDR